MGDEITGRVVGSVESMGGIEDDELCELIDNIMLEDKYWAYGGNNGAGFLEYVS